MPLFRLAEDGAALVIDRFDLRPDGSYRGVEVAQARLAPVYDLVTTSVYLPQDNMALTLDGTTRWPDARRLRRLGETRMIGTPARIRDILARIADAMAETMGEMRVYRKEHPAFAEIGERIMEVWEDGMRDSLRER